MKQNPTPNPITGLVHVTGEPDTGKTTFALSCGFQPSEIAFFDDDLKTQSIANQLKEAGTPLGFYANLTKDTIGMREIDFHNYVMEQIQTLKGKGFKVLVFDTWSRFENTFHPVVQKEPQKFKQFFSPNGTFKAMEIWKVSFDYEARVIDELLQVAPLVILITHLKDQTIGSVKTGAEIPDSKKPVVEKSRLRIWTRHNPDGPAPIGLVLKRLSKVTVTESGITPINVLPRKVNPCTWKRILEYWEDPIGDRTPSNNEVPNDFEFSILDGVLTADQKDALHINRIDADLKVREDEEAKKAALIAARQPKVEFSLDDLIAAFGEDEVKEANNGTTPETVDEIAFVTKVLMG